jgi:sortase B
MDYRCAGEYVPHIIIYGHNTRYGDMFRELHRFLDEQFLAEYPIITLKVNDRTVEYEIFSARKTDIYDPAYHLDFSAPGSFRAFAERNGAPPNAAQIITLSTCVSGNNDDERVIVQGALR